MSAKKQAMAELEVLDHQCAAGEGHRAPGAPPEKWGLVYLLARIFYAMRQRS